HSMERRYLHARNRQHGRISVVWGFVMAFLHAKTHGTSISPRLAIPGRVNTFIEERRGVRMSDHSARMRVRVCVALVAVVVLTVLAGCGSSSSSSSSSSNA